MHRLLLCALACLMCSSPALAGRRGAIPREDTPWYTPKDSWQDTVRASIEALTRNEAELEKKLATSLAAGAFKPTEHVFEPATPARHIKVNVADLQRLVLRTVNAHEKRRGHFTVAIGTPTLTDAEGKAVALVIKNPFYDRDAGTGHARDEREGRWRDAKLDGHFEKGIMIEREGEAVFRLNGKYATFEAWVRLLPNDSSKDGKAALWVDARAPRAEKTVRDADRARIWELIRNDFAQAIEAEQQQIEERDNIWRGEWTPGDTAALALRYAGRCDEAVRAQAMKLAKEAKTPEDLDAVRGLYYAKAVKERVAFARKTLDFVQKRAPRPKLAAEVARRSSSHSPRKSSDPSRVAARTGAKPKR